MKLPPGLLQEILDAPEDDAPRLVSADWLEEHGESDRAELIRVQCELARLDEGDPRVLGLRRREHELLVAHHAEWKQEVAAWAQGCTAFRRGFVGQVECSISDFLRNGSGLLKRAPVEAATLRTQTPAHFDSLAESPLVERLTGL